MIGRNMDQKSIIKTLEILDKGQRKDQTEFDIKIALEPFYEDGEGFVLATIMEV